MAKIRKNKSQIATIIVFIIAVIFLFALVSVNLSRIAQKKTIIDNVADGVGLQLASQLGSMAHAIKQELEIWGDKACDWNWQLTIFAPILVIVTVVLVVLTFWGGGVPGGIAGAALWGVFIGSGVATVGGAYSVYVATNPQAAEQMKIKFANMSAYQQIIEMPMQGVILSLSDDPTWVEDMTDMDRNSTTSRIPRVFKWYNLRLNTVPRAGLIVQKFYKDGFDGSGAFFLDSNGAQRFYIDEDENWKIKPGKDSVRWWIDFDSVMPVERELKIVPWIKEELIPMLKELRTKGYGVNVTRDLTIDDKGPYAYELMLGNWIYEVETFENEVVRSFYNMDFDSAVQGLNTWVKMLKKNDGLYNDPVDWYGRLRYLKMRVDALKDKLVERRNQIHTCVTNCNSRQGPDCFSENCENGPACASECSEWEPCPTPDEPDKTCCSGTRDTKWTGCCGEWKSCGELCYTECEPDRNKDENKCTAPLTGQKLWCCELTVFDPYRNPRGCLPNATIIEAYPNP
ncbi:MAG: hypothetical protein HY350_01325, partial [Candidatus Omnitrophica bacterium]|nr:hypothetical protein [Candidatus Omnitrophota bacterium]